VSDQISDFLFEKENEERLDHFLVETMPEFSRSRIQGLIKDGFVLVDGQPAHKAGQVLGRGSAVRVTIPPRVPGGLAGEDIPLDIIFENDDVLVINKPAGMVVHPSPGHASGTLVNAALGYDPDMDGIGGEDRPGVVHRLDKGTSGLILLAKNDSALQFLQDQFRGRQVHKTYLALVDGAPPTPTGKVDAPIGRATTHRKQMAIVPANKGREAVSEYRTLETFPGHTLLEFHPLTGRTHQIRVHCAFLGCPIVGDTVYGRRKPTLALERHFLHAARLAITLPGESAARTFAAPLPPELETVLKHLRGG
jgi:23S rRNA pseudouridine1911/1915/1917 synthase